MLFALAATLLAPASSPALAIATCAGVPGKRPASAGIVVTDAAATEGVYHSLRVTADGGWLTVFYDPGSEGAARGGAACLGLQIAMLRQALGDDRRDAEWTSVVFTQDAGYTPVRRQGLKARWVVRVGADGALLPQGHATVVSTIPHEQVHDFQTRAGARLPRWFAEGHASWVGDGITGRLDPAAIAATREHRAGDLAGTTAPLNLAAWGSVRPKREAIMRQVSPEDRARMESDPRFTPGGSFSFTQADFIGDESNMPARYAASARVFETLEQRFGAAKVNAFAREATATPGPVAPRMAELTMRYFGLTLDAVLALGTTPAG